MTWFTLQSLLVIALAFGLGLLVGWLAWGRLRARPQGLAQAPAGARPAQQDTVAAEAARPAPAAAQPAAPAAAPARTTTARRPRGGDDLERLVGIGPKIADALHAAGLSTYPDLASASEDILRTALRAKGLQFAPTLPTWPQQARLLADGDEAGFAELSGSVEAGRDSSAVT